MKEKWIGFIQKIKFRTWIIYGVSLIILLIIGVLGIVLHTGSNSMLEQTEARRWSEKKDAAQVSLFFSEKAYVTEDMIAEFRYNIDKQLADNSIVAENENVRLYMDSYCGFGEAILLSDSKSVNVNVIAVSGDFFEFHPLNFIHGSGFKKNDIMDDYVILDEETAWYLFGSDNLVGQSLTYNGIPITVSGVYHRDKNKMTELAGSKDLTVYMPYSLIKRMDREYVISAYEIVMPNPVKDFARKMISEQLTVSENCYEIVENSRRFTYDNYLELWKNRKSFSMKTNDIVYPFWENLARVKEEQLMEVAVVQWVLIVLLGSFWFVYVMIFITKHKPGKENFDKIGDFFYNLSAKRKLQKMEKQNQTSDLNDGLIEVNLDDESLEDLNEAAEDKENTKEENNRVKEMKCVENNTEGGEHEKID